MGSKVGVVVRALASHLCGSGPVPVVGIWVEGLRLLLILSLLRTFFSGFSGFPLSIKTSNSKFQFDLDVIQVFTHEPLARESRRLLPTP